MSNCLERCNEFARSKSARVIYGVVFTLVCIAMIYRLYDASNRMQERNTIADKQGQSNLQLLFGDDGSLIHLKDPKDYKEKLDEFLAPYMKPNSNRVKCDFNNPPPPGKSCDVDLNKFGPCSQSFNYGLSNNSLCVFLKLRDNPSWSPQFFNMSELPSAVEKNLKEHDKTEPMAWVTCSGRDPVDNEQIVSISYTPEKGFHDYQFAAMRKQNVEPLMGIFFERLERNGLVISVECKLWTQNSDDKVAFQLLLD